MRDAEKYEIQPLFVVVYLGEVWSWSFSEESALFSASECVDQQITDHWRYKLPVQVTPDIARDMDIRVYRLDANSQLDLPFQKWFDENYNSRNEIAADEEGREYKRFLELRAKYEARYESERSKLLGLPSCS